MPCVLTLLTDSTVKEPYAMVSMDSDFETAKRCSVQEVEGQIKKLTDKHATGTQYISSEAMYVQVVRGEGPQLSLIDLPGITHNATKMADIHEVTVQLVEQYIKPEEMVILCVIPAMSDFGNAEVVKLARKYDPDGIRTLGVVTKCDDAASAEASDIVDKVLMRRSSDVRLELGFHGVVNRSQRNIDEGMSRQKLWNKEELIFTKSHRMKLLPKENWGTSRLMEKVAKIQEARVDECLPRMKEAVRKTLGDLRARLRELPHQPETESDQARLFNSIVAEIRRDLGRRIRAEFVSAKSSDRELTIAPKIDSMVQEYKADLLARNPEWLQEEMIDEVDYRVRTYARGYTVDNLIGSEVFRNLIRQTFIEEGLLKESIEALVTEDSPEDSEDSDEESLPHGPYAENSSYQEQELSEEFLKLVKEAENVPGKFATLETCASLHVYTGIMIEGLVEESAKVIKFNAVGRLADKLEEIWRDELGANLQELLGWPL
ncbi:shi [Symbiodinium pilosum]|uniref:Shi protein n=1 Tax=Symbiodinium pilosum TaxID=2952 RepID=A0A812VRP6_SYMPI|nr:shi [Symbiodinium pilosum]